MIRFIKFAFVGTLGSITNIFVFFILSILGLHYMLNACLCFVLAVSQNYILNSLFTFQIRLLSLRRYLCYVNANILGLCVNLCVLFVFRNFIFGGFIYKDILSQAIGIFAAFVVNFLLSKYLVFKENR